MYTYASLLPHATKEKGNPQQKEMSQSRVTLQDNPTRFYVDTRTQRDHYFQKQTGFLDINRGWGDIKENVLSLTHQQTHTLTQ